MIGKIQKLETKPKLELLISTLILAIFSVLVINAFAFIIYLMELTNAPDFDTISVSFKEGFYTINGQKKGVSIFFNSMGIVCIWFLTICHTLKSIHKPLSYIL